MTQAIAARRDGDAFQARMFWLKAAKLLDPDGAIERVGFEIGPKGFDDLWVDYALGRAPLDHLGVPLRRERHQCKWHVGPGDLNHIDLTLPEYIGASTVSFLQRALTASFVDRGEDLNSRLRLVTNHRLDRADVLYRLIRNRSHTLDLEELFEGKTDRGAAGKVRKLWREHLSIDDKDLRGLCARLGISQTAESLDDIRERLDEACRAYGLQRIPTNGSSVIYDDVVRQWAAQGRNVFDRKSFREACQQEGLLRAGLPASVVFGVKSFEHPIDRPEDRCVAVLDLIPEFDDRFIRDSGAWRATLLPRLTDFLRENARVGGERFRLVLDAHTSLAFAAGTVLNTKSGRLVEIEQRTPDRVVWSPDDRPEGPDWAAWDFSRESLDDAKSDIALGIGLTHDVGPKVRDYAVANLPTVGTLMLARPTGGGSQKSVICGAHANRLAEGLAKWVKASREAPNASRDARLHVFIAAPNAFTFYLGRHIEAVKPVTLYEFDFQSQRAGSYEPSLSFP
jgi:hypothetical protein